MNKVAAIDIGSNAIRMVVGGLDDKRKIQIYRKLREPVRLGKDVFDKTKTISPETLSQVDKAFEKFKKVIKDQNISITRAIATSAVREASNAKEIIDLVNNKHGIRIQVIDGLEEARLIQTAIETELSLLSKKTLLIDIGGGSVEITLLNGQETLYTESFKLGTVRLLKVMEKESLQIDEMEKLIADTLQPVGKKVQELSKKVKFDFAIGTGGNIECLGVVRANYFNKSSMSKLYLEELEKIIKKLSQMSIKERIEKWQLRQDRADVILPASLVLKKTLQISKIETLVIPRVGLKDGILIDLLKP